MDDDTTGVRRSERHRPTKSGADVTIGGLDDTLTGESPALEGDGLERLRREIDRWKNGSVADAVKRQGLRREHFYTWGGIEVPAVVTPLDVLYDYQRDLGLPGEYPFTRGVHPTMYRGRPWTMRMFAGFGSPAQTNARFKYLLAEGQTGLSTAFDFPTLMGYDSDSPRARGEVGKCGVAVDTLRDMEILFGDIPLDRVSTSMTINGPAIVLLAFYVALADIRGIDRRAISGTVQNDCLKEFIAQHAWLVPPQPAMRIVGDMIAFASHELPRYNSISISGYHIREAGATAAQELAFTLANGFAYVDTCLQRGMAVDDFAPRLSFFFDIHNDFFEEICKLRAARRIWARTLKQRYGAKKADSMKLRTHAQTAGVSLTAQQPYNNVTRVALQALAGVLGGVQSLHTNSLDETYALPTEESVTIALRTQQIILEESGVANTVDPLGGSYYVEWLTERLEQEALEYIRRIDEAGGMVAAIERGYPQREIASSAYRSQRELEEKERVMVGVNRHVQPGGRQVPTLRIDEEIEKAQRVALADVKASRDANKVAESLERVRVAAADGTNLMPPIIEAAKTYATEQEICDVLRSVLGVYTDPAEF